jgi:hypothetical protein
MGHMNLLCLEAAPAWVEQRKVYRHPVALNRAKVRKLGQPSEPATLIDLSISGCRIETDAILMKDDRLWLRFENGEALVAKAIWCRDGQVGCQFDATLDKGLFRALTLITE